ncbi:MAG TPA: ribosome maturation factor RimM [Steroidobacteraceae bacterium]|nr:ribosome maturation factor RimM [Steroidobacteraceae bacterium]
MAESSPPLVVLGAVTAPFGVKGWVKLRSDTDPAERLFEYRDLRLLQCGVARLCVIEATGRSGGRLTAKFAGVDDRDRAAGLAGAEICVARGELPPRAPREHYRADLIGYRVYDGSGRELGVLDYFVETPAHALMVVRGSGGEIWVPATPSHLRRVEPERRRIVVDWEEPAE